MVLLENLDNSTDAERVCKTIHQAFTRPLKHEGDQLRMAISIGISHYPGDGADTDTLLAHADASMYRAKRAGGDGWDRGAPETNNQQ